MIQAGVLLAAACLVSLCLSGSSVSTDGVTGAACVLLNIGPCRQLTTGVVLTAEHLTVEVVKWLRC